MEEKGSDAGRRQGDADPSRLRTSGDQQKSQEDEPECREGVHGLGEQTCSDRFAVGGSAHVGRPYLPAQQSSKISAANIGHADRLRRDRA
jgi:hypothetical protein